MKLKKFILTIFILFVASISYAQSYKVFNPHNYTQNDSISSAKELILFIVDFSNSMNETIQGTTKIELALKSISSILAKLPDNLYIGLRVYGHKNSFNPITSCTASDLLVSPGKNNKQAIVSSLYSTKATGWTPITYSLKQAVNSDFIAFPGSKKRIILLTDGGENCDENPCDYAMNLIKTRDDIFIDVIAFDLNDKKANDELRCTALVTKGRFYKANTHAELLNSLEKSFNVKKEVSGTIIPR